jgi:hypothetical protein
VPAGAAEAALLGDAVQDGVGEAAAGVEVEAEQGRAPGPLALAPGGGHLVAGAFGDDLALELGEGQQDVEDPLGEGHPCTWRILLIKVAAEVVVRTRRIVIRLSSSWPHLDWYRRVCERLSDPLPTPVANPSG